MPIIRSLKSGVSQDNYGLSEEILKLAVNEVGRILSFVINLCIDKGIFPKKLK